MAPRQHYDSLSASPGLLVGTPRVLLLLVLLVAPLPATILAIPVSEVVASINSSNVYSGMYTDVVARLFALIGTSDISGVTILVPGPYFMDNAGYDYARQDNSTRKFNQVVSDALHAMGDAHSYSPPLAVGQTAPPPPMSGGTLGRQASPPWVVGQTISAAVAGALSDIWKFQIVKQYIPPSVATQKYSSGGPWELPTLQGQPVWLSYNPSSSTWNVSTVLPQQMGSTSVPSSGSWNGSGAPPPPPPKDVMTSFVWTEVSATRLLADLPNGEVAVYLSGDVLLPKNMDALGAYAGATTSLVQLLAFTALALAALLLA